MGRLGGWPRGQSSRPAAGPVGSRPRRAGVARSTAPLRHGHSERRRRPRRLPLPKGDAHRCPLVGGPPQARHRDDLRRLPGMERPRVDVPLPRAPGHQAPPDVGRGAVQGQLAGTPPRAGRELRRRGPAVGRVRRPRRHQADHRRQPPRSRPQLLGARVRIVEDPLRRMEWRSASAQAG